MGTVTAIAPRESATVAEASAAYLATLAGPESAGTRRAYSGVLRALAESLGPDTGVASLQPQAVAAWFTGRWGERSPPRWNTALGAVRSAGRYLGVQGWVREDPARLLRRRRKAPDCFRALPRADVERLLIRDDIPIRERTLWRLLYETAARSTEVLRLDVEDLDLANRRAKVGRKGGAINVIVWQTRTARLLPRLLKGRKSGPVFLTDRRARVELPPGDVDQASGRARLCYRQAEHLFKAASGGATLYQLRHSALTHDAEAGASTPMLMAKSGHTSVVSLARYARPSAEGPGALAGTERPGAAPLTWRGPQLATERSSHPAEEEPQPFAKTGPLWLRDGSSVAIPQAAVNRLEVLGKEGVQTRAAHYRASGGFDTEPKQAGACRAEGTIARGGLDR